MAEQSQRYQIMLMNVVIGDGRLNVKFSGPGPHHKPHKQSEVQQNDQGHLSRRAISPGSDAFGISLNIVLQVVGSQGDVQPFIALGQALQKHGHRVRLATHGTFQELVTRHGLEFFCIGGNPAELMAYMVRNPGLIPNLAAVRSGTIGKHRRDISSILDGCWRSCFERGNETQLNQLADNTSVRVTEFWDRPFAANVIIANPPSLAHIHCAEKLGIPLIMVFTLVYLPYQRTLLFQVLNYVNRMPWSPTQAFAHPLVNVQAHNAKPSTSRLMSYAIVDFIIWEGLGGIINMFRRKTLGLDRLDAARAVNLVHELKIPHIYLW